MGYPFLASIQSLLPIVDEMFVVVGDSEDGSPSHQQHERARLYCYCCPVQVQCLKWCVEYDQQFGVWGGLTESQRNRYLMPAIRKDGFTDDVLSEVIWKTGARIFKRLELEENRPPQIYSIEESQPLEYPRRKSLATTNA